jgi:hypothetical protein
MPAALGLDWPNGCFHIRVIVVVNESGEVVANADWPGHSWLGMDRQNRTCAIKGIHQRQGLAGDDHGEYWQANEPSGEQGENQLVGSRSN